MKVKLTAERASELIKEKLSTHFGLRPEDAGDEYIYKAVVLAVKDILVKTATNLSKWPSSRIPSRSTISVWNFLWAARLKTVSLIWE